jgi:GNAT superfamily N-acetyltransferase
MPPVLLWNRPSAGGLPGLRAASDAAAVRGVQTAVAADIDAVRSIAAACRRDTGGGAGPFAADGIVTELRSRPQRCVRAWFGSVDLAGPPVGLVTLVVAGPPPGRCSIGWLLVTPSCRRRGVAAGLVAHALDAAQALGHERIHVETLASWTDAVAFWRAMGFASPS